MKYGENLYNFLKQNAQWATSQLKTKIEREGTGAAQSVLYPCWVSASSLTFKHGQKTLAFSNKIC